MKKKIKDLTSKDIDKFCGADIGCRECPLSIYIEEYDSPICCLADYLEKEVEVQ